jgi:hypothetical protein
MFGIRIGEYFHASPHVDAGHDVPGVSKITQTVLPSQGSAAHCESRGPAPAGSAEANGVRPPGRVGRRETHVTPGADPRVHGVRSDGAGLPERYIAKPDGELRTDEKNVGVFVGDSGRRYLQIGENWYRARQDEVNGPWRVVLPDEPDSAVSSLKPGIPVERGANGAWAVRREGVGLAGGMWHDGSASARDIEAAQLKRAEERRQLEQAIREARATATGYEWKINDFQNKLADAQRRVSNDIDASGAKLDAADAQRKLNELNWHLGQTRQQIDSLEAKRSY